MVFHNQLGEFERKEALKAIKKQLTEKINEQNELDLPEGLVKEQVKFMVEQAKKTQEKAGSQKHDHDHEHLPDGSIDDSKKD